MIYKLINIYKMKDNRLIAYVIDDRIKKTISYPRVLMSEKIGRKLKPKEEVHHIDQNVENNDISNLQIVLHGEHQREHGKKLRKYFDKISICPECGKEFLWTAKQQRYHNSELSRKKSKNKYSKHCDKPFCSKICAGKYSKRVQLENK